MEPFYQLHGIILSYGYIPVNHVGRFYRLFVWIGRLYRGDLLSVQNAYIPCQTDSSLFTLPCTSIGMFCVRLSPAIRFCWSVLRSAHACCLPPSAKQNGLRKVAFLFRRRSGSLLERSHMLMRLSSLPGSLLACVFPGGDPDMSYDWGCLCEKERRFCVAFLLL